MEWFLRRRGLAVSVRVYFVIVSVPNDYSLPVQQ